MSDTILVLNAGSSSLKFSVFVDEHGGLRPVLSGMLEEIHARPRFKAKEAGGGLIYEKAWNEGERLGHDGAVAFLFDWLQGRLGKRTLTGVGSRVVHGGTAFAQPVRVTPDIVGALEKLSPLAPLHQGPNLLPIKIIMERLPRLPQVACFDTAFHRSQPPVAQTFAIPRALTESGVRRYGFHGLSYEYIASLLPQVDPKAAAGRTVVLHLGNGASMCALLAGRSVASSMGFTAVDGLPMGTRCGSLDAGALLYLMDEKQMDARALENLIYRESGLLGVSGISSDMRVLLGSDDPNAAEAVELFCYRIGRELGSLAAALGGLDAIVFTAGIGEHAAPVREAVCRSAAWLGLGLDVSANAGGGPRISTDASQVSAWVLPTNEELMIAQHTQRELRAPAAMSERGHTDAIIAAHHDAGVAA
jgi:acetate kinase